MNYPIEYVTFYAHANFDNELSIRRVGRGHPWTYYGDNWSLKGQRRTARFIVFFHAWLRRQEKQP